MKRLIFGIILVFFLGGCGQKADTPLYRVVTGVQVQYRRQDDTIYRTYTKPSSMQSILTYLRILKPFGPVNPVEASDSTCRIVLQYSQGPDSVYLQQGQNYLQCNDGEWESIDAGRASLLYPLLLLLPSDS